MLHFCAVTVSPAGPRKLFKGVTTATSDVLARFPLLVRNSFASYGASAVTRTSDRGHVAEARNQGHRSGGVPIRVSKEILLPLNVHWCSVSSTKMLKSLIPTIKGRATPPALRATPRPSCTQDLPGFADPITKNQISVTGSHNKLLVCVERLFSGHRASPLTGLTGVRKKSDLHGPPPRSP